MANLPLNLDTKISGPVSLDPGKQMLSFVPISVWDIRKKSPYLKSLVNDNDNTREVKRTGGALGKNGLRFSEFMADVAYRIIEFWGADAKTVLDPFAGRYTRMIISLLMGKNYIGYDVVQQYVDNNRARYEKLKDLFPGRTATLITGDGCQLKDIKDDSQDFIFTCPPYYDLEIYKEADNQLSRLPSYEKFLDKMKECLYNCHRVLKPQSFCVFVVADWHRGGKFYPFHSDLINTKIDGFHIHDIVINKIYSPFIAISSAQNKRFRWMGKAHEYILVWRND